MNDENINYSVIYSPQAIVGADIIRLLLCRHFGSGG